MRRTNIYLTDDQRAALAARAAADRSTVAELIRRILDRALAADDEDLAGDLAAIDASFGALQDEEVEIDRRDGAREAHLDKVARA